MASKYLFPKGKCWLGRLDSNQGMAESKSAALPLGYAPMLTGIADRAAADRGAIGRRTIATHLRRINLLP